MKPTLFLLSFLASCGLACAATDVPTTLTEPITEGFTIDDGTRHELIMSVKEKVEAGAVPDETPQALNLKNGMIMVTGEGSELYVKTDGSMSIGTENSPESGVCTAKVIAADGGKITLIGSQVPHSSSANNFAEAHHFWVGAGASPHNSKADEDFKADVELSATGQGSEFLIDFRDFSGSGSTGTNWGGFFTGKRYLPNSKGTVTFSALEGGTFTITNVNDYTDGAFYGQFFQAKNETTKLVAKGGGVLSVGGQYTTHAHTDIDVQSGGTINIGHEFAVALGSSACVTACVDGAGSVLNFRKSAAVSSHTGIFNITKGGVINVGGWFKSDGASKASYGDTETTFNISGKGSLLKILGLAPDEEGSWANASDGERYKYGLAAFEGGIIKMDISEGGAFDTKYSYNAGTIEIRVDGSDSEANNSELYYQGYYKDPVWGNATTTDGVGKFTATNGGRVSFHDVQIERGSATFTATGGGVVAMERYANKAGTSTTLDIGADPSEPATLAEGGSETASGSFHAATYENHGKTEVNIAAGASAYFDELWLVSGEMVVAGQGGYVLGSTAEGGAGSAGFHVTGASADSASSTCIDATGLASFGVAEGTTITLVFTPELQTSVEAGDTMTLTLVQGYDDFTLSDPVLSGLLASTTYVSVSGETYTDFSIANASYRMDGNNLVWTNAPAQAVPEPATATLSLLALASLAARRRRR